MEIYYSSKFEREYRALPKRVKIVAEEKEMLFKDDPHDPRLRTHKLRGPLRGYWAFSINNTYRIIFEFADRHTAWFHSVGDHSIYQ